MSALNEIGNTLVRGVDSGSHNAPAYQIGGTLGCYAVKLLNIAKGVSALAAGAAISVHNLALHIAQAFLKPFATATIVLIASTALGVVAGVSTFIFVSKLNMTTAIALNASLLITTYIIDNKRFF